MQILIKAIMYLVRTNSFLKSCVIFSVLNKKNTSEFKKRSTIMPKYVQEVDEVT